ncbi:DUF6731 family protein [Lysinibacillus fusiformis]
MARKKRVGFNFFRLFTTTEEGNDVYLNITNLLEQIRLNYLRQAEGIDEEQKLVYSYQGEPAKLADVRVDENNFYHLTFERLLNYQLPIKTTLHGESDVIDIEENEFVGHEVSVLYDPIEHVMMVQRNRDSLGPTAISEFLNSIVEESELASNAFLSVITDREARHRGFNQNKYKKLQVKVSGMEAQNLLRRLLDGAPQGVETVELIVSSGRGRESEIENESIHPILERYVGNDDVQKLKVSGKYEEYSNVEPVDLLNQKLETFVDLDYREHRYFNPISVYEKMLGKYIHEDGGFRNIIQRM